MPKVTTPSDRVQLIGQGQLMHPGCCALCGSGNSEDGYVDTGIFYDYEGQVYFCVTCATQIANVIGCLAADEVQHLQALLAETATQLKEVKEAHARDAERLNDYDNLMLNAIAVGIDRPDVVSGELVTSQPEAAGDAIESAPESLTGTDSGEPVVKKSVASGGRRKPPRTERSDSSTGDGITI